MLLSHERELLAARNRGEPAGQIAARELEIVRIGTALRRADELTALQTRSRLLPMAARPQLNER